MKLNLKRFSLSLSLPRKRENFFLPEGAADGGWLKIRFFVRRRPRAVLDRAPREKRKIPATVKFLFKIGTARRAFKGNARDSRRLILRPGERWIRAFFDKFEK